VPAGLLPAEAAPVDAAPAPAEAAPVASAPAGSGLPEMNSKMPYIVQPGDTLGTIAKKIFPRQMEIIHFRLIRENQA
jgi:nucleoid-associated protein YgaU